MDKIQNWDHQLGTCGMQSLTCELSPGYFLEYLAVVYGIYKSMTFWQLIIREYAENNWKQNHRLYTINWLSGNIYVVICENNSNMNGIDKASS